MIRNSSLNTSKLKGFRCLKGYGISQVTCLLRENESTRVSWTPQRIDGFVTKKEMVTGSGL
jgi:hypothetical protein